jgi:flagellar hook-length control protein FliK
LEGGEIMQVGGLGLINSSPLQKGNNLIQQNNHDFASVLTGMIQTEKNSQTLDKLVARNNFNSANEEIASLLEILNSFSPLTDPVSLNQSEIGKNDLGSLITTFLRDFHSDDVVMDSEILKEELAHLENQLQDMNFEEVLMSFIQILSLINVKETNNTTYQENNLRDLQKSSKGIDIWINLQNPDKDPKQLKDLLQKVTEKLEAIIIRSNRSNRTEYLEKVFVPIINEGKERSTTLMQSRLALPSNGTLLNDNVGMKSNSINISPINADPFLLQNLIKPEQLTLTQGQTGKQVSTEQLIQQFESILSKSQYNSTPGQNKLYIKLYPEHLGPLRIELIQKDSMVIAKLMTTTSSAKELLESQLQSLKNAFNSQNIQVERIEISNGMNFQDRFVQREQHQQPEQQEQRQQNQQEEEQEQLMETSFANVLLNVEV